MVVDCIATMEEGVIVPRTASVQMVTKDTTVVARAVSAACCSSITTHFTLDHLLLSSPKVKDAVGTTVHVMMDIVLVHLDTVVNTARMVNIYEYMHIQ